MVKLTPLFRGNSILASNEKVVLNTPTKYGQTANQELQKFIYDDAVDLRSLKVNFIPKELFKQSNRVHVPKGAVQIDRDKAI